MKQIVLISPAYRSKLLEKVRVLALPPLNLAILASHTPSQYQVRIIDEAFEDIDYDLDADLVGITCMTPLAPRAYEISREFRKRGVPVVLGGIHASMVTEDAARHADAVVVGEGEEIWPRRLEDFAAGGLQPIYRAAQRPDLAKALPPRRELLNNR
ncbi:MAG: cobalamin-dependent protein [Desulfuromonadaceae bacterium]